MARGNTSFSCTPEELDSHSHNSYLGLALRLFGRHTAPEPPESPRGAHGEPTGDSRVPTDQQCPVVPAIPARGEPLSPFAIPGAGVHPLGGRICTPFGNQYRINV